MKALQAYLFMSLALLLLLDACAGGPDEDQAATLVAVAVEAALTETAAAAPADGGEDPAPPASEAPPPAATTAATDPPPTDAPPTASPASTPVVVFQAAGSFSDAEKNILRERVILPFIHYHADLENHPAMVSMSIEHSASLADYPYAASAIFEEGITSGFLIHATGGVVDWWYPECLVACEFSAPFRAAYPEIIAIVEP